MSTGEIARRKSNAAMGINCKTFTTARSWLASHDLLGSRLDGQNLFLVLF